MASSSNPFAEPVRKAKRRSPLRIVLRFFAFTLALVFLLLIAAPLIWWHLSAPEYDGYNYYSFQQLTSNDNFLSAGEPFPARELITPDGEVVHLDSLWKDRPLIIETGSSSCPIYKSHESSMSSMAASYADQANVVVLYTREAHPGLFAHAHRTFADKLEQAHKLEEGLKRQILVDDVHGSLHQQMGGGSNSVYIVDTDGIVAHYAYWNDPEQTERVLNGLLEAGGISDSLSATSFPCRDLSKVERNFTPQQQMRMALDVVKIGGLDALVDFMANMIGQDGGPDPLCKSAAKPAPEPAVQPDTTTTMQ